MKFELQAACICHTGKVRKNNEDNFVFDGKYLEENHQGLKNPVCLEETLKNGFCAAVFDGMGGENFGEVASYAAAQKMQIFQKSVSDFWISEKNFLKRMTQQLNNGVVEAQEQLCTEKMGTTMVCLYFRGKYVYVCNIGDSRAYRLRNGEFLQISKDHIALRPGRGNKKAPLTQYLGLGSEEVELEPFIAKGELQKGDIYLLCSDGLSDMLTNFEISDIMLQNADAESCVENLLQAALEHGGRDNITVIVCKIL